MKKQTITIILISILLTACSKKSNSQNLSEPSVVTEESVNIDTNTEDSLVLEEHQEESLEDKEFWFDYFPELYGEIVSFTEERNEFIEYVTTDKNAYSIVVDLDNDGINEAFVCTGIYDADFENIETDDLYFIDENKAIHELDIEGNYEIGVNQQYVVNDFGTYITINGVFGLESDGDIYTLVDDKLVNVTESIEGLGKKFFSDKNEIIWCKTGYMGFCETDKGVDTELWTGRTYIPYAFKLEGNDIALYPCRKITLDEVNKIATFEDSKYPDVESVCYLYCDNGELRVNYVLLDESDDCLLYTYKTDVYLYENNTWVFQYWAKGYYEITP